MYRHLISRMEIKLFEAHRSWVICVLWVLWSTFEGHVALGHGILYFKKNSKISRPPEEITIFVISNFLSVSCTEFLLNIEAAEIAVLLLNLARCSVPFWNGPPLFCFCCGKYLHEELFIDSA